MPKPEASASAVIVSGGKQYRVSPGDRILVDRLAAEPGSSFKIGRLLLFSGDDGVKVGSAELEGLDVDARVIAHRRGPRIESIRYKSKKRVRVHRGGRADLTALEIIAVGGIGLETEEKEEEQAKPAAKRGRAKAAPKKKKAETKSEAKAETKADAKADDTAADEAPKKATTRKRASKKETE